jgi:alpha-ribazole phosphatase
MALVRRVAVTLLRHGLTHENKLKQYIGRHDPSLCDEGIDDLQRLMKSSDFPNTDVVLSSDRKRCIETAGILYPNHSAICFESFCEIHFGEWEGKTYETLKFNTLYQNWLDDPSRCHPPGGETYADFERRMESGWRSKLVSKFDDDRINHLVLITHGGPIRYYLSRFGTGEQSEWPWKIEHGRGFTLKWDIEGLRRGQRCISLQEVPFMERQNG